MRVFKKRRKAEDQSALNLKKIKGPIKLNIGCGTDYKKGWINIDNNSDDNIEKLDLNWDLRNPLPFEDGSVDYIFNEHFFEHLTVMVDLKRVLKDTGVLRIAMPDLEAVVDTYINVPLNKDPVIKEFKIDFIQTRAEWMNMSFRWWGHQWLYDWEELERRLKEAGFTKLNRCKLGKSKHVDLRGLETRNQSLLIAEASK
jgi:predicted SAM-dependent methyltransferase